MTIEEIMRDIKDGQTGWFMNYEWQAAPVHEYFYKKLFSLFHGVVIGEGTAKQFCLPVTGGYAAIKLWEDDYPAPVVFKQTDDEYETSSFSPKNEEEIAAIIRKTELLYSAVFSVPAFRFKTLARRDNAEDVLERPNNPKGERFIDWIFSLSNDDLSEGYDPVTTWSGCDEASSK